MQKLPFAEINVDTDNSKKNAVESSDFYTHFTAKWSKTTQATIIAKGQTFNLGGETQNKTNPRKNQTMLRSGNVTIWNVS